MSGRDGRAQIIFVVDDEPLVRSTICDHLEHEGYAVATASSGDEAYDMIAGGLAFDLLLTDVRMPGTLDGFDLVERVLARDPAAKTIVMSGYAGERGTAAARGDAFIAKPFTVARLHQTVASLLPPASR